MDRLPQKVEDDLDIRVVKMYSFFKGYILYANSSFDLIVKSSMRGSPIAGVLRELIKCLLTL